MIATGYLVRNRYDQALILYERVIGFADLSDTTIYAAALNNAGVCIWRPWAA